MSVADRRLLPTALGAFVLLAVIGLLGVKPRLDRARELDRRLDAQAQREATLRADIGGLLSDRERLPANRRALRRLGVALPPTARSAGLLRELDVIARRHHVALAATEVTATGAPSALPPGAQPAAQRPPGIPMRITLDGSYPHVRRLLAALDAQVRARGTRLVVHGRLLTIDGLSTTVSRTGGLETVLAATAHVAPDAPAPTPSADRAPTRRGAPGDPFGTGVRPAGATPRRVEHPATRTALPAGSVVRAATTAIARAAASASTATGRAPQTYAVDAVELRASRSGHVAHAQRNVARLTLLPSPRRPAAMYVGLLKDRRTVALLVGAGAKVTGGRCRPSRTTCTTLLLAPGSRARIADPHNGAVTVRVVRVRHTHVTGAAAARDAGRRESAAGRCLLAQLGVDGGALAAGADALRWTRQAKGCAR